MGGFDFLEESSLQKVRRTNRLQARFDTGARSASPPRFLQGVLAVDAGPRREQAKAHPVIGKYYRAS